MPSKRILQLALVAAIITTQASCIMFKLVSNEPTCLKINGDNVYTIYYVVSGENDKGVKMEAYDNEQFMTRK